MARSVRDWRTSRWQQECEVRGCHMSGVHIVEDHSRRSIERRAVCHAHRRAIMAHSCYGALYAHSRGRVHPLVRDE